MAPQGKGQGGALGSFLMLFAIIIIFYLFLIRPQMKKQKEVRNFRSSLKKGDKVLTIGGIYGKITDIKDTTVTLEIAENVRIKVDKSGIINDSSALEEKK
ncbi:MAG: preprotein translocase subunit YajC [Bacteroidetes bacterium]|nr:MAG: preprotein translocase subunit YajC [Bacteroidota bacterium]